MSKDVKPKIRIGRKAMSLKKRIFVWTVSLALCGGLGYGTYYYGVREVVDVPTVRVKRGDFVRSVKVRGEVKSTRSVTLYAPRVPSLRIVKLAQSGKPVRKGDLVVEFDAASQENSMIQMNTQVASVNSSVISTRASHKMQNESDELSLMQSEFALERAKLDASKAEIVSEIEGAKSRITVGLNEGSLDLTKANINLHQVSQQTDLQRLNTNMEKVRRDLERVKGYLDNMEIRAPVDGSVNILSNFRSGGDFGSAGIPFREGDTVPTGMPIAEIPDLSEMRAEMKLEEVDRGKVKLGMSIRVRIDAIPDKEFEAVIDWISPIAALSFRGNRDSDKLFPAYATLKSVDPRLRAGMSASLEIIIESQPSVLMIPLRAGFTQGGKPSVFLQDGDAFRPRIIEVGGRNEDTIVVANGLLEGDMVTMEDPKDAAKRAKKKL
jgi:multidrug efflux pump subunit AcrA (membrane-fusion protein)